MEGTEIRIEEFGEKILLLLWDLREVKVISLEDESPTGFFWDILGLGHLFPISNCS